MAIFYASPTGTSGNAGSIGSPWSLAHAMASGNTTLQPGDTVRLLPGGYDLGTFTATKAGAVGAPIVYRRHVPGERTYLEGNVTLSGAHTWLADLELCWTGTETRGPVPDETALTRWNRGFLPNAAGQQWIECDVHDMTNGVFAGAPAVDFRLDDCRFYNQGMDGNTRGHGHALYLQNDTGTKRVRNCLAWGGYQFGLQVFGSAAAVLRNITLEDSAFFQMGISTSYENGGEAAFIMNGGSTGNLGPVLLDRCSLFRQATQTGTLGRLGLNGWGTGLEVRNSTLRGYVELAPSLGNIFTDNLVWVEDVGGVASRQPITATLPGGQPDSIYTIDRNAYHVRSPLGTTFNLTAWRARGYDVNGTLSTSNPSGFRTRVIPTRYGLSALGHVHVWNFAGASTATVDLGPLGLDFGMPYAIYHAFDYVTSGPALVEGTYTGQRVTLPMDARTPPRPYGAASDPPTMPNTFGAFVVTTRPGYTPILGGGLG